MIRPTRRYHRGIWLVLLVTLPFLFFAALRQRDLWHFPGRDERVDTISPIPSEVVSFRDLTIRLSSATESGLNGRIVLQSTAYLSIPDLWIYVTSYPGEASLPKDAMLLGRFISRKPNPYLLPVFSKKEKSRYLLLYSPALGRILARSAALPAWRWSL